MFYNSEKHRRISMGLKGYNYAEAGSYFVTICTNNRESLLGTIIDREMQLNEAGRMVHEAWNDLSAKNPGVEIDEHIIMPNHMHGIIILVGAPLVGALSFVGNRPADMPIDNIGIRAGTRPALRWVRLSAHSNLSQRINMWMVSDSKIGHRFTANYGSAIITST